MTDALKSSRNKRRLHEIDDTIESLTHAVQKLSDFMLKSEFETSIMTAKLKREKVKALTAVAKSQVILAEMDILIAESDLYSDLERLKNSKRIKLDRNECKSQNMSRTTRHSTPLATSSTNSKSMKSSQVQTKAKSESKKSYSSKKKYEDLDKTVLVETIKMEPAMETLDDPNIAVNINNNAKSDSEISVTSSINAEFNNPYTLDNTNTTHTKNKSETKAKSKTKSSKLNVKEQNQSMNSIASITTKTVAEINQTISNTPNNITKDTNNSHIITTPNKNKLKNRLESKNNANATVTTCTYVPIRHNMPMIITEPKYTNKPIASTTVMSPCLYMNTLSSPANLYQNQTPVTNIMYQTPSMGVMNNSQNLHFFGKK